MKNYSEDASRQYHIPVSYTHLDVYKRQTLDYPVYRSGLKEDNLRQFETPCGKNGGPAIMDDLVPVSYTHLNSWYGLIWMQVMIIMQHYRH